MNSPLRVLIVEDSESDALLIIDELRDGGYAVDYLRVESRQQMEEAIDGPQWDIIISDFRLPDFDGLEALEMAKARCDSCPFILVSGQIGEDVAVSAVKAGASDYVLKDNLRRLVPAVEREIREGRVRRERAEAQAALQAERERSHEILDSITDGFYALDKDWRFTYVNSAAERVIGQDWRSLKGKSLWEVFPYAEHLPVYEELHRAMVERVPVTIERFYDRLQVWYTIHAYPYADGLAIYLRDVTREKRAEEEIRTREDLLQTIQNSLTAQIAVLDSHGTIIAVNETWTETARARGDTTLERTGLGANYLDVCRRAAAEGVEVAREALDGIVSVLEGRSGYFEMEYPFPHGDRVQWFYMRVSPLRSESGGAVVVHLEVTQRVVAEQKLRASEERLRKAMLAETIGVLFFSLGGGVHETNATFERWSGYSVEELRSMTHWEELTAPEYLEVSYREAQALATEGKAPPYEKQMVRKDGSRWWGLFAPTVLSGNGDKAECVEFVIDITERKRAEAAVEAARRRAEALEAVAYAGITTPDLQELLDILVRKMTEVLRVDSCSIWIVDDDAREFEARAECGVPGLVGTRLTATEGVAGLVYRERHPVYTADAEHDPRIIEQIIKGQGTKSLLTVPLIAGDRVVGMTRVGVMEAREFTREEAGLLEAMASRAAQAIENIRLVEELSRSRLELEDALGRERHFSLLLQRALLPEKPSINDGYSVAVEYVPYYVGREIGGDFYDVFELPGKKAGIIIGDVSGKGLEAASLASATRNTIHALVYETASSGQALSRANSILCKRSDDFESQFVTALVAVVDLETGEFNYASAGHPPAALYRSGGEVEFPEPDFSPPVCVAPWSSYAESSDRLRPGDALVMYTDGVLEARLNGELFDIAGIAGALKQMGESSADEIAGGLVAAASEWAERRLTDDAAVVVIKRESTAS